jgi:hypothetical protein
MAFWSCRNDRPFTDKDSMDLTQIAVMALGLVCACLGWFARQVWGAVQELKKDVSDLRVLIGTDYVRYDRLQDALKPVMDSLQEIKQTLSGKADK